MEALDTRGARRGGGRRGGGAIAPHDRPWTLTGAPGVPVRAPVAERADNPEPGIVVPVAGAVGEFLARVDPAAGAAKRRGSRGDSGED